MYSTNGLTYDDNAYRSYERMIATSREMIFGLPKEMQQDMMVYAKRKANQLLNTLIIRAGPMIDPQKWRRLNSAHSDYLTDLKGLHDIVRNYERPGFAAPFSAERVKSTNQINAYKEDILFLVNRGVKEAFVQLYTSLLKDPKLIDAALSLPFP